MGFGIKSLAEKFIVRLVKRTFNPGIVYDSPSGVITANEWLSAPRNVGKGERIEVIPAEIRDESPPVIVNHEITARFRNYYHRTVPAAYIVMIKNGRVAGASANFTITPDGLLVADLSREFGRYGGRKMEESSLITRRLQLAPVRKIEGKVAVITTTGYNNFHHWNYDSIPRLSLLKQAALYDQIDFFIIAHNGLPFQKESLRLLNIPLEKIINPVLEKEVTYQASELYIPSLPSALGTVSPWVVSFLRGLYLPLQQVLENKRRIYLSRRNAPGRRIVNHIEFMQILRDYGFEEIFPEEHSVSGLAKILSAAETVLSVHGSGLSNLCFIAPGTLAIDILAPYHQDAYYWMISNIRCSKYIGIFGEGEHPPDSLDLVQHGKDEDIFLNLDEMRSMLQSNLSLHENI